MCLVVLIIPFFREPFNKCLHSVKKVKMRIKQQLRVPFFYRCSEMIML